MAKKMLFTGSIKKVTPGGRSATVHLDEQLEGYDIAVISPDTQGRRGLKGLVPGARVKGFATPGPDALDILMVEKSEE